MISGFDTAFGEVTLVLFTTLAPSGAVALAIVAAVLLFAKLGDDVRARINKFMCIPLVVTMVGLIASATHLGNPANALYVFMHVGSSPLSNEVSSARGVPGVLRPVLAVFVFGEVRGLVAAGGACFDRGYGRGVRCHGVRCVFR